MKIHVIGYFQTVIGGQEWVTVKGATVGECLDDLVRQFPKARTKFYDNQGNLYGHVAIFLNGRLMTAKDLGTPVKPGDDLSVMPQIGGG